MNKLFPIVLALLFFGCDEDTAEKDSSKKDKVLKNQVEWDYKEQHQFLTGCKSGSTRPEDVKGQICLCTLNLMMEEYSFEEYVKNETKLYLGNASDEFMDNYVNFIMKCGKDYSNRQ